MYFRSDMTVKLVDCMGSDDSIVRAMLVSTQASESLEAEATRGRINFLMRNRHGTPFEHNSMTFFIEAPIFVFREFHRHRIGWSYNEESARYKQLEPVFYIPDQYRHIKQEGKPGAYIFTKGNEYEYQIVYDELLSMAKHAYYGYERMLQCDIAKEVARMCLPVNIYSSMYATCNARSLMHFLSLRVKSNVAKFPSFPMREIEMVAEKMEGFFMEKFPLTYTAFIENGLVAP